MLLSGSGVGESAYRILKQVVAIILGCKHKCVQAIANAQLRPQKLHARDALLQ